MPLDFLIGDARRHPATNAIVSLKTTLAGLAILICDAAAAHGGEPPVNLGHFNKLAMNGYDVMTYWRGGKPREGDRAITYRYKGATWVFVSAENRRALAAEPEKYAPRYGGYCPYAAAQGRFSDVDPFAWQIYQGRLHLNYGPRVQRDWGSGIDEYIAKADAYWPGMVRGGE
jgi:hypothetical protein